MTIACYNPATRTLDPTDPTVSLKPDHVEISFGCQVGDKPAVHDLSGSQA